jgi:dATP pyrophosphohydrolase
MIIKTDMIEAHIYREFKGESEFLLIKRSEREIYPGLWQMVSGKIEKGEKAHQAAKREILEETGLLPVKMWVAPNINSFYSAEDDSITFLPVFLALVKPGDEVLLSDEHTDYGWFSALEAKEMLSWPGQKNSIDIIVNFIKKGDSLLKFSEILI